MRSILAFEVFELQYLGWAVSLGHLVSLVFESKYLDAFFIINCIILEY